MRRSDLPALRVAVPVHSGADYANAAHAARPQCRRSPRADPLGHRGRAGESGTAPGACASLHVRSRTASVVLVTLLLVLLAVGFRFSLTSLAREWRYDSPSADLVLVPLLAVPLFIVAALRHGYVTRLRQGWGEFVLAFSAVLLSFVGLLFLPAMQGNYFWALRLDMLLLPVVAGAGIALFFGTRALLAFAYPLTMLFLAWPLPWQPRQLTSSSGRMSRA